MMAGLPAGWESGYDGRRWFYTYRATGHVQYGFPCEGDEFPDFVDEGAPAPALAPEERLESQQQLRRQTAARGPVAHDRPRMSATAPRPVSDVWEGDLAADDDDDDGGGGGGRGEHVFQPESFMFLGPGAYADVSPLVEDEDEAAKRAVAGDARDRTEEPWASSLVVADVLPHELPVDDVVSPPGGFDPVGHVAEMPTEQTPASRADLHPEPVEMADPSVLAPVETVTAAELLQSPASPGQQEAVKPPVPSRPQKLPLPRETQQQAGSFQQEAKPPPPAEARRRSLHAEGLQAAYQPYVPGPLRSVSPSVVSDGSRRSSSAELQRELSLMMASRPAEPAALDPTAVPRVLSPPQVPPRKPVDGTGALRQDLRRSSLGKGPSTNSSPGTDHQQVLHVDEQQRDSLQELRQPAAPPTSTPPTDDQENGGPGGQQAQKTVLSKFPSVLKPARGRGAMLQSRRVSLAQQDEAPAPAWSVGKDYAPRRPLYETARPSYQEPQRQSAAASRMSARASFSADPRACASMPYQACRQDNLPQPPPLQGSRLHRQFPEPVGALPDVDGRRLPVEPQTGGEAAVPRPSQPPPAQNRSRSGRPQSLAAQPSAQVKSPIDPSQEGRASSQEQPVSTGRRSPELGLRRVATFNSGEVSPLRPGSESQSTGQPLQTPSPVESFRRDSSNPSLASGTSCSTTSIRQSPEPFAQLAARGNEAKRQGPAVPAKIPLDEVSGSYFPVPPQPLLPDSPASSASQSPYLPSEYPVGFQVKSSKAIRRLSAPPKAISPSTAPSAFPGGIPEDQRQDIDSPQPPSQGSSTPGDSSPLDCIEEHDERRAVAVPIARYHGARPVSMGSGLRPSPPTQKSSLREFAVPILADTQSRGTEAPPQDPRPSADQDTAAVVSRQPASGQAPPQQQHAEQPKIDAPKPTSAATFGAPTRPCPQPPLGKDSRLPVVSSTGLLPASASQPIVSNRMSPEKDRKWTKWFKSSKPSQITNLQPQLSPYAHGRVAGQDNANQLPSPVPGTPPSLPTTGIQTNPPLHCRPAVLRPGKNSPFGPFSPLGSPTPQADVQPRRQSVPIAALTTTSKPTTGPEHAIPASGSNRQGQTQEPSAQMTSSSGHTTSPSVDRNLMPAPLFANPFGDRSQVADSETARNVPRGQPLGGGMRTRNSVVDYSGGGWGGDEQ